MNKKKILAARILNTSPQKVRFASDALADIQKAITRSDMRGLIAVGKIKRVRPNEQSRGRARKIASQKRKGRRQGHGSRKGSQFAGMSAKQVWMNRVRVQRTLLQQLRDRKLLSTSNYRMLYLKSKGGFFRNRRHIKLYITEYNLLQEGAPTTP